MITAWFHSFWHAATKEVSNKLKLYRSHQKGRLNSTQEEDWVLITASVWAQRGTIKNCPVLNALLLDFQCAQLTKSPVNISSLGLITEIGLS